MFVKDLAPRFVRRRLGQEGSATELQPQAPSVPFPALPLTVGKLKSYLWALASSGAPPESYEAYAAYAAIEHVAADLPTICSQYGPQYPIIARACSAAQFYVAPAGAALAPVVIAVQPQAAVPATVQPAPPPPPPPPSTYGPQPQPAPPVPLTLPPVSPPQALPYGYTISPEVAASGVPQVSAVPTAPPPETAPVVLSAAAVGGGLSWGWLVLLAVAGGALYYAYGRPAKRRRRRVVPGRLTRRTLR